MRKLLLMLGLISILAPAQVNNSPNMNLPIPIPGQTSGPQWAQDINASLTLIDQHNHTAGNGVQIPPAGININTALPFNNNSATSMQASVYTPQASYSTNFGVHSEGVDLYFVDGNGNDIKITSGGSVNATSSGISSGTATASFSGSPAVLIVNAASSTPANIQGASLLMGNNAASSKFLTLAPPASMAANITETLPAIPSAQSFLTMDTGGNIANYAPIANGITRSNLASVGQQISASSGNFSTTSTSYTAITNLSVTITTSGRPVVLTLIPDGSLSFPSELEVSVAGTSPAAQIAIFNTTTSTNLAQFTLAINGYYDGSHILQQIVPAGSVYLLDTPSAGTYTYAIEGLAAPGSTLTVFHCKLLAYEL